MVATYKPEVFYTSSLEEAKDIILTAEGNVSRQERWEKETPLILNILRQHVQLQGLSILDFGCGVGRLSKPLAELGNTVIGVDMSPQMREHAIHEVNSARFTAISPVLLDKISECGMRFDLGISIWVLQHCLDLEEDAQKIIRAIKPGGGLLIVDMYHRAVPTNQGWINDGKSVLEYLKSQLTLVKQYPYDMPCVAAKRRQNIWIGYFVKQ